jgi:hypothetical protein
MQPSESIRNIMPATSSAYRMGYSLGGQTSYMLGARIKPVGCHPVEQIDKLFDRGKYTEVLTSAMNVLPWSACIKQLANIYIRSSGLVELNQCHSSFSDNKRGGSDRRRLSHDRSYQTAHQLRSSIEDSFESTMSPSCGDESKGACSSGDACNSSICS